ncbi:hypothetical protein [Streptosporangium sp. NPDC002607]
MTSSIAAIILQDTPALAGRCLGLLGRRTEAITKLTEAIALMEQFRLSNYRHAHTLEILAALLLRKAGLARAAKPTCERPRCSRRSVTPTRAVARSRCR